MAEDSVAETGVADANDAAAMLPILPPTLVAATDPSADTSSGSSSLAAPEPIIPPATLTGSRKARALSVGASVAGHLLIGLLVFGSFSWPHTVPDVIPVKLIPADQAPPQKPKPPEKQTPPAGQHKAAQQPEPKPSTAQPAPKKDVPVSQKPPQQPDRAPAPANSQTDAPKKGAQWGDIATSLGIAEYGRKTTLPDKLLAAIAAQVSRCWSIPSGWNDPQQVSVTLRFQLNPQGALDGDPSIVRFPATPMGVAAAKAAIKAVTGCGPYRLPAAQYDQWKDIQVTLAP
jgi:hypothetical protein